MTSFLKVLELQKTFSVSEGLWKSQTVAALNGVSFEMERGQTLGLVGESGSGKSTLARCVTRLIDPTSGQIEFNGTNILNLRGSSLQALRRKIQIIFQDPLASLNPRMKMKAILEEPLLIHRLLNSQKDRGDRIQQLLETVGLRAEIKDRYAHELSGGQRQRIGLARALAVEPELIVCDEPVSALDVSIQAQVINLLMDLQEQLNLTYLFIAHDLKVVQHMSSKVAVMKQGQIVEMAPTAELFHKPRHPYTQTLLSSIPRRK